MFTENLGIGSMMTLEILAAIEKKYKIEIKEVYLPMIATLNQKVELAKKLINTRKVDILERKA